MSVRMHEYVVGGVSVREREKEREKKRERECLLKGVDELSSLKRKSKSTINKSEMESDQWFV